MGGQDLGLAARLEGLGAGDLARHVASGSVPPPHAFEHLRGEFERAAAAARTTGEHALLAGDVRRVLDRGGHLAATVAALLSGDRSRLPSGAPAAAVPAPLSPPLAPPPVPAPPTGTVPPAPSPRPTMPSPSPPPAPFAVTAPALRPAGGVAVPAPSVAGDGFAWGAVAASAVGALLAFRLPLDLLFVAGPLVSIAVIGLLVTDRVHLEEAGRAVPAWGWTLLPPAYLFRRGRKLGQQPIQAYALVGIGMATRLGLVVFGLGGADVAALTDLEAQLADDHAVSWGQPVTAACPPTIDLAPDVEFTCVVTSDSGDARIELRFRAVDDTGTLELLGSSFSGHASSAEAAGP